MSFMQGIALEIEARQLIRQARRVNRKAARDRGERICLACRVGIHHRNVRRALMAAALIAGVTLDIWTAHMSGWI